MPSLSARNSFTVGLGVGLAVVVGTTACSKRPVQNPRPRTSEQPGAAEHATEASRHDSEAQRHDRAHGADPETPQCFDRPLAGIPSTGGQRINVLRPCWTAVVKSTADHKRVAQKHRETAARHRVAARQLVQTERKACKGLGVAEISTSPFWHRKDIASARPVYHNKHLRGATVTFRKVRGLNSAWLRRAARCHRARAAVLGFRSDFMSYCPLVIDRSHIFVRDTTSGVEVTIRSTAPAKAAEIWARAQRLTRPR